ncbi:MAG: anaerobic ribonucleoside-triphosphate reductase activating protein [Candidatus Caldatribacteriota bacterium]|nr:anaerobic ribonucleoside-triphosphate reductase activating protein [Atribacterota bacterium]MDD3031611.1 anaerobic ribonucleoside-triphosphate reductase activating protein [Atribacterota bacterium]MDD3640357.1 anaerobic ribonucleoside-triphosphate reductase activating protein [Atribacterota bacterium]MDD4288044.1 anaerobic ribonucleoside-triphosphate reductase activating protein [Atribacterota bacterium]MDD4764457.1 anaerobic ribonucleoside-triphosphate reductase activating protein [Atribact
MIKIKKIISTSLIDWEGMIVSTLYVGGCNFRCPFCYNTDLVLRHQSLQDIPIEEMISSILSKKPFLDGICLSGGEPTLNEGVKDFLLEIKKHNLKIKIDTNGSNPEILKDIIEKNLVDYIAMDIKTMLREEDYSEVIGLKIDNIISKIRNSINLIMNSGIDYEFRTTIIPKFHDIEVIKNIAEEITGARRYILQRFIQSEEMLDPDLKDVKAYDEEKITDILKKVKNNVLECRVR